MPGLVPGAKLIPMFLRRFIAICLMTCLMGSAATAYANMCACMKASAPKVMAEMDCHKKMAAQQHDHQKKKECCCENMIGCKFSLQQATLRTHALSEFPSVSARFFVKPEFLSSLSPSPALEPPKV